MRAAAATNAADSSVVERMVSVRPCRKATVEQASYTLGTTTLPIAAAMASSGAKAVAAAAGAAAARVAASDPAAATVAAASGAKADDEAEAAPTCRVCRERSST
jgi:hypothetical protein